MVMMDKHCLVSFYIGKRYFDGDLCDVMSMGAYHLLLGMSHVCGVTAIAHPHSMDVCLENMRRQEILVSYHWKNGMGVAT
jgi:hypothetical protein